MTPQRLVDLLLVSILIIPSMLFILFLSLLTIIFNHFSPFFVNKRLGKDGKVFTCIKLQCLHPATSEAEWGNPQNDRERMTTLGAIYRDQGWDELPQIVNILKGEMTFVGPRPIMEKTYEELMKKYPKKVAAIKNWKSMRLGYLPGLSGWHQIHLNDHNIIKYDNEFFYSWTLAKYIQVLVISSIIFLVGKSHYYYPSIPPEVYEYVLE